MPRSFPRASDDDSTRADSAHPRCRDRRSPTAVAAAPRPVRGRVRPDLCHRAAAERRALVDLSEYNHRPLLRGPKSLGTPESPRKTEPRGEERAPTAGATLNAML